MTKSIFGVFVSSHLNKEPIYGTREHRVEIQYEGKIDSWMSVMRFYGIDELKPNTETLCEMFPLSQEMIKSEWFPCNMLVKYGPHVVGKFFALYAGPTTYRRDKTG